MKDWSDMSDSLNVFRNQERKNWFQEAKEYLALKAQVERIETQREKVQRSVKELVEVYRGLEEGGREAGY